MERFNLQHGHPDSRKIDKAVEILKKGGVIAYPTDTVYGLGCDITSKKAIERIYRMKNMPKDHPIAFVCPNLSDIAKYALIEDWVYRIMKRQLPGPYCFVLPATREVPKMLMMKRKHVGIRVPDHPIAREIALRLGRPILSTSATFEGEQLMDPDDIALNFPQLDALVDTGYGNAVPSTVVDLTSSPPEIIREGLGAIEAFQ